MLRCVVVLQVFILNVNGTFDFGLFRQRHYAPTIPMNCFEYTNFNPVKIRRAYNDGRRYSSDFPQDIFDFKSQTKKRTGKIISRKIDIMRTTTNDILKEHSKLVQDINGLKQFAHVAPLKDNNKDYDESIFHELIETSPTPKMKRIMKKPSKSKSSSIPIILAGAASNNHEVRSNILPFEKSVVNLVGTTSSPIMHPYPFVQATSVRPIRICMPSLLSTYVTTTEKPSLWETFLRFILPK